MASDEKSDPEEMEWRELDAAVAREVFGLDVRGPEEYRGYWIYGESPFANEFRSTDGDRGGAINGVPRFSEKWGPAGRVVEEVDLLSQETRHPRYNEQVDRIRHVRLFLHRHDEVDGGYWCVGMWDMGGGCAGSYARGDTAPLAICRAAIKSVRTGR